MRPSLRDIASALLGLLVAVAGSVWVTWPMAAPGWFGTTWDSLYAVLSVEQVQEALAWGTPLYDGPLMHPLPRSLTFADVVIGQAVMGLPLRWAGIEPLWMHNLLAVAGVALTAWALMLAARALTGPGLHTVWGAWGAWGPAHLVHVQHLNLIHHQWGVFGALLVGWGLHRRQPVATALGGLLVGVGFAFGAYVGVQGGWMVLGTVIVAAWARAGDRRSWLALGVAGVLAALMVWPLVSAYGDTASRFALWATAEELREESWDLAHTLAPARQVWAHQYIGAEARAVDPVNPGYAVALLAVLGLVALGRPRRERWGGWAVVTIGLGAALLALGPELMVGGEGTGLPMPYALIGELPGLRGLRAPVRWIAVSAMAAALGASWASAWLWRRFAQRRWTHRLALALGLVAAAVVELPRTNPVSPAQAKLAVPEVYRTLDKVPGRQAVFDEALLVQSDNACGHLCGLRASLYHERPVLGGAAARWFDEIRDVARIARTWPDGTALELFQVLDVGLVVDHPPLAELDEVPWASCREVDGVARVCDLELPRRAPLPPPDAVTTEAHGPVIGLRWPADAPAIGVISLTCAGLPAGDYRVRVYQAVSGLRHGPGAPLEVFLAEPCTGAVSAPLPDATPLYRREGTEDQVWRATLAPRTRSVAEAAEELPPPYGR